jgi:site-specific recombinase XerD
VVNVLDMLDSWELAMRAQRKSPQTIKSYGDGVKAFSRWCETTGTDPQFTKTNVQQFITDLLDGGAEAGTAEARLKGLRRYAIWLSDPDGGDVLDSNPLAGIGPVKVDRKITAALDEGQIKALIKACAGRGFIDRRDEAIVRLMVETGARAGEVVNVSVDDCDLKRGTVVVRRGKGGKGRILPIGPQTGVAIDRYLRMRSAHPLAHTPDLWLGGKGRSFQYHALHKALGVRARAAGIQHFHPHLMRHTAATRWLAAGGSEQGLMAVAGWSNRVMLDRYTAASASQRAVAEAQRLQLGDL